MNERNGKLTVLGLDPWGNSISTEASNEIGVQNSLERALIKFDDSPDCVTR